MEMIEMRDLASTAVLIFEGSLSDQEKALRL
jgi:hypothetical protein